MQKAERLEDAVARAQSGDRAALETVVTAIQKDVYGLALRFLWHPEDAEDAAQEILVRVVTHLGSFEGKSRFRTWVFRVATNALLSMRGKRMEQSPMSFTTFGQDLAEGLSTEAFQGADGVEAELLLEEVKIGCTHAMLLCLDRGDRLAFILGEILELDHNEGAQVLDVTPAAYRKRLSRARRQVAEFMKHHCGLFDPKNTCRCWRRAPRAIELRRVDPEKLLFATNLAHARHFPKVLAEIRRLEETRRAAALLRSHPEPKMREDFVLRLQEILSASP